MAGTAMAFAAWWTIQVLRTADLQRGIQWRYNVSRINELRWCDSFYRLFQPAIQMLAKLNRKIFRDSLAAISREIQAAGLPRFWLAEEYLAKTQLIALYLTPVYLGMAIAWFGGSGWVPGVLAGVMTAWWLRLRLAGRARWRLHQIKRRMPFLLDLLTLLMEAGSAFTGAMKQAVEEFQGHPVAEEFGRVLGDMNLGKTRAEAFRAMRDRLADDEITSIIGTILQGEMLGTPLAKAFRTQADVLRLKRSQRAGSHCRRGGGEHAAAGHVGHDFDGADYSRPIPVELSLFWIVHAMTIAPDCPSCQTRLRVPNRLAGSYVPCRRCNGRLWVEKDAPTDDLERELVGAVASAAAPAAPAALRSAMPPAKASSPRASGPTMPSPPAATSASTPPASTSPSSRQATRRRPQSPVNEKPRTAQKNGPFRHRRSGRLDIAVCRGWKTSRVAT